MLVLLRVFEPEFCKLLMALYEKGEAAPSGVMSTDLETGKTILKMDGTFKKRRDVQITDETVRQQLNARLMKRQVPEVKKVFQFDATRIERYIVARYNADEGGFFRRIATTPPRAAHRCFAVTINLNAEDYEGGDLRFAEYDRRTYRAPTGGCGGVLLLIAT